MSWMKPEMVEIKMDAEISSYQGEDYDPLRDGPPIIRDDRPAETDGETLLTRV
jgi:hypothetical protein